MEILQLPFFLANLVFWLILASKGKVEMRNFTTEGDDTLEAMKEDDIYGYLGHLQSKQIKHAYMKQKLAEEYLNPQKKAY